MGPKYCLIHVGNGTRDNTIYDDFATSIIYRVTSFIYKLSSINITFSF